MRRIHVPGVSVRTPRNLLGGPHAGGFDCPTTLVGASKWVGADGKGVNVYYEPSTGAAGQQVAQNVLGRIDDLMNYCDAVFGVRGKSGNVIVCTSPFNGASDGSGGAYHFGCSFNADAPGSDWYEDLATGNPDLTFGLVMAEVSESYMGLQNRGWNCGGSGGEGLSRYLAEIVSGGPNGALRAFESGSSWNGQDWISKDQGSDQDYPSIGCAVLYLWWMTKLGFTPQQITQAGESDGTLAGNYQTLTGKPKTQAFNDFRAAVAPAGHASDNPFNAPTPPYPLGGGVPPPPPPPPPPTGIAYSVTGGAIPKGKYVFGGRRGRMLLTLNADLPVGHGVITPASGMHLGAVNWQWLVNLVKTVLATVGGAAVPMIEAWVAKLPLPPVVIAAIDALIEQYLGGHHVLPAE